VTRPSAEVQHALALAGQGLNNCQIARQTGIPRRTISDWTRGRVPARSPDGGSPGAPCPGCAVYEELPERDYGTYSYLLGIYLGDGWVSPGPRGVFRLRVLLDRRYPGIVDECLSAMRTIVGSGRASVYPHPAEQADEVSSYWKHWPCVLPQHGRGRKHNRRIELTDWQREITECHPGHPRHLLRVLQHGGRGVAADERVGCLRRPPRLRRPDGIASSARSVRSSGAAIIPRPWTPPPAWK
jgi:hypothetical protein